LEEAVLNECARRPVVDANTCETLAECGQILKAEAQAVVAASSSAQANADDQHQQEASLKTQENVEGEFVQMGSLGRFVPRRHVALHGWGALLDRTSKVGEANNNTRSSCDQNGARETKHYDFLRKSCRIVQYLTSGSCDQRGNFLISAREVGVDDLVIVFTLDVEAAECVRNEQRLRAITNVGGVGGHDTVWPDDTDRMVPALDLKIIPPFAPMVFAV
jgi:hypothetical protein